MPEEKDFDGWNKFKKKLNKDNKEPIFRNREIWWCSVGVNIGCEEDGKNEQFERPVLIYQKLSKNKFYGLPLSTKSQRFDNFCYKFSWKGKDAYVLLDQMRSYSTNRLGLRYGDKPIKMNHFINIKMKLIIVLGLQKLIPSPFEEGPQTRGVNPGQVASIIICLLAVVKLFL